METTEEDPAWPLFVLFGTDDERSNEPLREAAKKQLRRFRVVGGELLEAAASLDLNVTAILVNFWGRNDVTRLQLRAWIFDDMRAMAKLELLKKLLKHELHYFQTAIDQVDDLFAKIKSVYQCRNDLAHQQLIYKFADGAVYRVDGTDRHMEKNLKPVNITEIRVLIRNAVAARTELRRLRDVHSSP